MALLRNTPPSQRSIARYTAARGDAVAKRSAARKPPTSRQTPTLSRADWLAAARDAFIKGGVHAVKVDHLARRLGVTRGSFYFHFRGRADLLDALFQLWRKQNVEPFDTIARDSRIAGWDRIRKVTDLWLEEVQFSPAFDTAMRDWGRASKRVADAVGAADQARIALFHKAYNEMGFTGDEAFVRARVTYFHQVGYYTLAIRETRAERQRLLPFYNKILSLRPDGA